MKGTKHNYLNYGKVSTCMYIQLHCEHHLCKEIIFSHLRSFDFALTILVALSEYPVSVYLGSLSVFYRCQLQLLRKRCASWT